MGIETWQVYVLAAVILMISEIFVPGLILLPIGLGVLISAGFAAFITSTPLLILVTAICVSAVFFTFRKFSYGDNDAPPATAVDAMIGKDVTITEKVTSTVPGYAKLYGDNWKALSITSGEEFNAGDIGVIQKVEGNKIFISKKS